MASVYGWLFIAARAFTILGAAANWEWFMNSRKAQFFLWLFGRDGARVVYFVLGLRVGGIREWGSTRLVGGGAFSPSTRGVHPFPTARPSYGPGGSRPIA